MKPKMGWPTLLLVSVLICGLSAIASAEPPTGSALWAEVVVKVADREKASAAILAAAEKAAGYFSEKSERALILKVPVEKADEVIRLAEDQGQRIERSLRRDDLSEELLRKRAALKAKQSIQAQYLDLLGKADLQSSLTVEKSLVQLTAEIETLQGQLRYLRHRLQYAEVRVLFEFEDRNAPVPTGVSSFAWLNTLNLKSLLEEF